MDSTHNREFLVLHKIGDTVPGAAKLNQAIGYLLRQRNCGTHFHRNSVFLYYKRVKKIEDHPQCKKEYLHCIMKDDNPKELYLHFLNMFSSYDASRLDGSMMNRRCPPS